MVIHVKRNADDTPMILFTLLLLSLIVVVGIILAVQVWGAVWDAVIVVLLLIAVILSLGLLCLLLVLKGILKTRWLQDFAQWTSDALYPFALSLGRFFGIPRDVIRRSYVAAHNQTASLHKVYAAPDDILVLLPHCIQWSDCRIKITNEITNCRQCGHCTVGDLVELRKKYGVHMHVATGGTLARKLVKEIEPYAIVGVACERDLVSGIRDVRGMFVVGITNERPNGPCFNTTINVGEVEQTILSLLR